MYKLCFRVMVFCQMAFFCMLLILCIALAINALLGVVKHTHLLGMDVSCSSHQFVAMDAWKCSDGL